MMILSFLLSLTMQQPPTEAERLRELEEQIREQESTAAEIRERAEEREQDVERLRSQLVSTAATLQAAEKRATELEGDLADIEAREAVALEERDARSFELSQVLAALQNLERSRPPALVVSPDDAQSAALAAISLSSLTPRLAGIVEARKAEIVRLAQLREEKRTARAALDDTNTALVERRRLLEGLLSEREEVLNDDLAELQRVERETRRLASEASTIRELLARLADLPSSEDLLASYRASRRDRDLPSRFSAAKGQLNSPVAGVVTGRFGVADDTGEARDAVEFLTRPGAVVTAPFSGRVQWASEFGALGNILILDVGEGYSAILIGLDRFIVQKGQRLSAGEPVGIMGPGPSSPRLRYQIRERGQPVDPGPWIESAAR